MTSLALVVPCKDEGRRLVPEEFLSALATHPYLKLVFVDDGSSDDTAELLSILEQASPAVHAIYLPRNRGKAEAVRQGVLWALDRTDAETIGFWDADLATPLDELDAFVRRLDACPECQAVIGARWPHLGARIERSSFRNIVGAFMKTLIGFLVPVPVYDTQCGAKLFRRELAAAVFARPFVSRWLFDVEILRRIPRARVASIVAEAPLSRWRDVADSRLGVKDCLMIVPDLLKIGIITA